MRFAQALLRLLEAVRGCSRPEIEKRMNTPAEPKPANK